MQKSIWKFYLAAMAWAMFGTVGSLNVADAKPKSATTQGCTENQQSCLQGCGRPGQQPECERQCRVLYNKCMGLPTDAPRSAPRTAPKGSLSQ